MPRRLLLSLEFMWVGVAAVAILLRLIPLVHADSPLDRHRRVQRWIQERNRPELLRELLAWQKIGTPEFSRNNYDYLLGRTLEQDGRRVEATRVYQQLVEKQSSLRDHALWHLAGMAHGQNQLSAERWWLRQLIEQHPQSLWIGETQKRLAENLFEDRLWQESIGAYRRLRSDFPELKRETELKIALADLQLGRAIEARGRLLQLVTQSSTDDTALTAVRTLDQLDRQRGTALSEVDHYQRGRVYQNNRFFADAREHFQWIVDRIPGSAYRAQGLFELGRGLFAQGRYNEAIVWYERAHDEFPREREGEQAYYQVGHAHARAGRSSEAVGRYEDFIRAYPESEWLAGAHLNAIDALRTAGKSSEALSWCERTRTRFPGELAGVTALFSRVRIRLAADDFRAALGDLDRLLEENLNRSGPGAPNRPEVIFLKAHCLEQVGLLDEAIEVYLSLPEERDNFYGQRASARLRALLAGGPASRKIRQRFERFHREMRDSLRTPAYPTARRAAQQALRTAPDKTTEKSLEKDLGGIYRNLPAYQRVLALRPQPWTRSWIAGRDGTGAGSPGELARELAFLGLWDEAARALAAEFGEVDGSTGGRKKPPALSELFTLAVYFHRGGDAYRTIRIGERHFAGLVPADFRLDLLSSEVAHLLYPVAYRDELVSEGGKAGLDPRFVLAIARQESRFRADAKSSAGARGLLQFVPETANRMAIELKIAEFSIDALYQPALNIRLGVAHLRELLDRFQGSLAAASAAYNSGEENVDRWRARSSATDEDRFLAEIAFRETKDYVRKVLSNYWAYQQIVDERLNPF